MRAVSQKNKGFTIVELVVVIVVIGILAGIVAISYNSWRTTTAQNEVKSNLNGVFSAMESARTFSNSFPLSIPTTIASSQNVTLTYARGSASSFCITGTSTVDTSVVYYADSSFDKEVQQGACPAIITNLVSNPSFELNTTGWAAYTGVAAPTRVLTSPWSGSARLSAVGNNTTTSPRLYYVIPVTTGDVVAVSARVRSDGQVPTSSFMVIKTRLAGAETATPVAVATAWSPDAAGWMKAAATYTVPVNVDALMILPGLVTAVNYTGTLGVDGVMFVKGAQPANYADGDSAHWSWDGTANASTSTGLAL